MRISDWSSDVCSSDLRAEALNRFMTGYAALARLPSPRLREVELASLLTRVAQLEQRLPVALHAGPALVCQLDPDQLEQALRSAERSVGKACVSTCRSRCSRDH